MDAFDIAQLMANQDAKNPIKMRYGTVKEMGANGSLSVVPDGQTEAIPAIKCCRPSVGSRVVMLVNGTEWLAVSVIGGDYQSAVDEVVFRGKMGGWDVTRWTSGQVDLALQVSLSSMNLVLSDTISYTAHFPIEFASLPFDALASSTSIQPSNNYGTIEVAVRGLTTTSCQLSARITDRLGDLFVSLRVSGKET